MSTPRLDLVYDGFIRGIGDRWDSAFDPTAGQAIPDSVMMEKEIIPRYVNRALWKLFDTVWLQVEGDAKRFGGIFPELIKKTGEVVFSSGAWTIAANYLDIHTIFGAWTDTDVYVGILSPDKYSILVSGKNRSYIPTATTPAIIKMSNVVYIFPTNLEKMPYHY